MNLRPLLFSLCIALLAPAASAQKLFVAGEGSLPCSTYLEQRSKNNNEVNNLYGAWTRGFLSGFNWVTSVKPMPSIPDTPATLVYLDKYCREKPADLLVFAADQLGRELGGIYLRKAP